MGQCSGFSSLSGCCQCPVNNPQSIGVILNTADLSLYTARPSQEQALWRRQKLSCLEGAGGQAAALQRPPLPLPCRGLRRAPAPALPPLLGPRYRVKGTVARGYRISQPQVVMSSRGEEVCVVTMPQSFPLRVWVALFFWQSWPHVAPCRCTAAVRRQAAGSTSTSSTGLSISEDLKARRAHGRCPLFPTG